MLQTGPGPVSNEVTQVPTAEQPWSIPYSHVTLDANEVATGGQSVVVLQALGWAPPSPAPLANPDAPASEAPDPDSVDPVAALPADAVCPDEPTAVPDVAVPLVPASGPSPTRKLFPPQPTAAIKDARSAARRAGTTRTEGMAVTEAKPMPRM